MYPCTLKINLSTLQNQHLECKRENIIFTILIIPHVCMEISAEKTPVSHGSLFSMGSVMHGCYGSPVIQSVLEGYYLRLFTICHAFCVFVLAGVLFILQRASVFFCYSNCDCEDTNPISFSRDNSS